MDLLEYTVGVTSRKFLGFVVCHRGVEIDPAKIKAIIELRPPKKHSGAQGISGFNAYIHRFISSLSGRYQSFSRLMKKDTPFEWDENC